MTAVSSKVTASTVAASLSTLVFTILAPHLGASGLPGDVVGLIQAAVAALVTFAAGYLAREVAALEKDVPAPVVQAVKAVVADIPSTAVSEALPVAPVAVSPAAVPPMGG